MIVNMQRNLIKANLLSGDKGPTLLQQNSTKGIPNLSFKILVTMIFRSDRPYHNKTLKKYQGKYPLKAIETKIIKALISKALHTTKQDSIPKSRTQKQMKKQP